MAPSNGSTGTPSNKTTNRKPVRRALNGRVKRERPTPPHAEPPMGTGRRFATAPAPATTPERPSGATPSCRLGVGERRRGPLTTLKAARNRQQHVRSSREPPADMGRPRTGRSSTYRSSFGCPQAKRRRQNTTGRQKHPTQHDASRPTSRKTSNIALCSPP